MLSDLRFRLRALLRRTAVDAELDDELRAHIAQLVRKYEEAGLAPAEAARRARLEFGGLDQIKAECHDARGIGLVETVAQDVRYAARALGRDASFTLIAIITLALGIGASTTVFSIVNAVLLKPLPYQADERIVFPWRRAPATADVGFDVYPWGRLDFLTMAERKQSFEHLGAFLEASFNLTGHQDPARFDGARVSAGFFRVFGVAPQLGRAFTDDEDRPGRARVVVLSDELWRSRFNADPGVVGRPIDVDGSPHTVVGVMPAGFTFPHAAGMPDVFALPRRTALWVPLALSRGPRVRGEPAELAVVGRLASTASVERGQAEFDALEREMERQFPEARGWFGTRVIPIAEQLAGGTRRPLLLLLGAVAVLLVIVCANLANLLLARSIVRAPEMTLRAALGAARRRLVRQLATEHLLLAALGGTAGLVVASVGVDLVQGFAPASVPNLASARIDVAVLGFSVAVSLACGVAFGAAPALAASREDLTCALRAGGRSASSKGGSRARSALLVAEVALSLVLLIASGLLGRTFVHLAGVDAGFDPERALAFQLTLPPSRYTDLGRIVGVYQRVLERLRALPGVESVGIGETVPMGGAGESTGLRIPDRPTTGDQPPPYANYTILSPGYLAAVGTSLLQGRDFSDFDTADSLPVAIVSAAMAKTYWPGQDVIGKQVGLPISSFNMTIVGVVADVKHVSLREEPAPEIYVPYTQKPWPSMSTMHVVVRTRSDPTSITGAVRHAVRTVDAELPVAALTTLDRVVDDAMARERLSTVLVGGFAALSLLLACVGLYGAVSYAVTSRAREIGVRLALGAPRPRVLALVLVQCLRVTMLGIAIGVTLALVLLRAMTAFLYGVEPADPATFAGVSLLLLAVALLACYVPARRALRVDPLIAMRSE